MEKLIEMETPKLNGKCYKILEIGSWAGNSALVWASSIKKFNKGNGLLICVDPWQPYLNLNTKTKSSEVVFRMEKALKKQQIFNLFIHNISSLQHEDIVRVFRGYSDEVLPMFRDNHFNLIFVDGSHSYSQVIKDLKGCERLLCRGGVVCGDDLELQKHEIDVENARKNKDKDDCILDEKSNAWFHPGVTLAVGEFFGKEISSYEGFWVMRKTKSGWQEVELD